MSLRVDQLALDLAIQARAIGPPTQEAFLTALQGLIAASGERLTPATVTRVGAELQAALSSAGGAHCHARVADDFSSAFGEGPEKGDENGQKNRAEREGWRGGRVRWGRGKGGEKGGYARLLAERTI